MKQIEETLLFMAMRYAIGRKTAIAITLPCDIVQEYYDKFTDDDKLKFRNDICNEIRARLQWQNNTITDAWLYRYLAELCTKPSSELYHWYKFYCFLGKWVKISTNEINYECFKFGSNYISVDEYIKNPYIHSFLDV